MLKNAFKALIVFLLTFEAKRIITKYKPRIIAVTGSVGKTSTKDAIFSLLSAQKFVRKSEKSFNSEIGVPLTILGCPNAWNNPLLWLRNISVGLLLILVRHPYPEWLVLEVGADRPGDIKKIAKWLSPDIVVVTRLAPVPAHIEFFGSADAVANEKSELVKALQKNGTLIVSRDDEAVYSFKDLAPQATLVTFGFSRKADVRISKETVVYEGGRVHKHPVGMTFVLESEDSSETMYLKNSVGKQFMYALGATGAVGKAQDMDLSAIAKSLSDFAGPPGRMRLIAGIQHATIIDDTYNSSPIAAREALDALLSVSTKGKKIAVLGDMLELGRFSVSEHKSIGAYAATRADMLITVGVRARDCADGALAVGMNASNILQFDDSRMAANAVKSLIRSGDMVLVKGSQSVRMERVVAEIMEHPEERQQLLVRQEKEWGKR